MNDRQNQEIERLKHQLRELEEALNSYRSSLQKSVATISTMRSALEEDSDGWPQGCFSRAARERGLPKVFGRILADILEGGWGEVYDRWVGGSSEGQDSRIGPGRSGGITVIPGEGGSCTDTVVVFIKSEELDHDQFYRFPNEEIEALKLHLIECHRVRGVLIITEALHPGFSGDEFSRWLRAWATRGVAFSLAVVAPGGRFMVPVPLGA
jgi:hypothetical protein